MTQLSPSLAAAAASGVYGLRTTDLAGMRARGRTLGIEADFDVTSNEPISGRSGLAIFRSSSGFGYVARGRQGSDFEDDLLLVMRGTHATSVHDWLTNLTIAMEVGPGGALVHAGFNRLRNTMARDVNRAIQDAGLVRHFHVVGHSLGGALATLNGADLVARGHRNVSIYTFGAPRVGNYAFVQWLERRIGGDNIRRVYHPADPVPMIPLFPFFHAPGGSAFALPNSDNGIINPSYHGMEDNYVPGTRDLNWNQLAVVGQEPDSGTRIQAWLAAGGHTNSLLMGSARLLGMIGDALAWIIRRSLQVVCGSVVTVGATVLDRVAAILVAGAEASIELSRYVMTLVRAIFRFLGRTITAGMNITRAFLHWVLELLFRTIANGVTIALSRIDDL